MVPSPGSGPERSNGIPPPPTTLCELAGNSMLATNCEPESQGGNWKDKAAAPGSLDPGGLYRPNGHNSVRHWASCSRD